MSSVRSIPIAFVIMVGVLAFIPIESRAVGTIENCIELLCELKRHIAVGWIEEDPSSASRWDASAAVFQLTSILKGSPPVLAQIRTDPYVWTRCLRTAPYSERGKRVLVFFGDHLEADYVISLDGSDTCAPALTRDFQVLRGESAILAAVCVRLERMRREGRPPPGSDGERVQRSRVLAALMPESPAARATFHGSANIFLVPADPEYRIGFLRDLRSLSPSHRAAAALRLGMYPGIKTLGALRRLLTDGAVDTLRYWREKTGRRFYPVRQAAYLSLRQLGASVSPPAGYVADIDVEEQIRLMAEWTYLDPIPEPSSQGHRGDCGRELPRVPQCVTCNPLPELTWKR